MRYVLAMLACLFAFSSVGCVLESEPGSQSEASSPDSHVGTAQEALFCKGDVVCINHVLWCQPLMPGQGNPTPIGKC
jgi:hypothetical protein